KPLHTVDSVVGDCDVQLVFWFDRWPLGRAVVAADALPLSVDALAAVASNAVAPAVAARLFAPGFAAPLPAADEEDEAVPDIAAVLACARPLQALRPHLRERDVSNAAAADPAPGPAGSTA